MYVSNLTENICLTSLKRWDEFSLVFMQQKKHLAEILTLMLVFKKLQKMSFHSRDVQYIFILIEKNREEVILWPRWKVIL